MSRFEVKPSFSEDLDSILFMQNYITIKSSEDRWKNFKPIVFSPDYQERADKKKDMEVFSDDVFICSFPRSGTTLTQEIAWLILNDFNFEKAKAELLDHRVPELEYAEQLAFLRTGAPHDPIPAMKRPRVFKTHLPVHMLPDQVWTEKPKIIYISRDVKDVVVSFYHLYIDFYHATISREDFYKAFMQDRVQYAPFREHRLDFWKMKDYDNVLFITFEELVGDTEKCIRKICDFLGKTITAENMQQLKEHIKLDSMKNNAAINNSDVLKALNQIANHDRNVDNFIRKGLVGGYSEEMPEKIAKKFDEWMQEEVKSGWEV